MSIVRRVPVKLQVGKKYVTNSGEVVTVIAGPNVHGNYETAEYCYSASGVWCGGTEASPDGIARPYYEGGGVYVNRAGEQVVLGTRVQTGLYPLRDTDGTSYTLDGRYFDDSNENCRADLLDFYPQKTEVAVTLSDGEPALDAPVVSMVEVKKNASIDDMLTAYHMPIQPPTTLSPQDHAMIWELWLADPIGQTLDNLQLLIDGRKLLLAS